MTSARAASAAAAADVVLAQLEIPIATVADAARRKRREAVMILNAAPSAPLPDELWNLVDLLVVDEHEAADLARPTASRRPSLCS